MKQSPFARGFQFLAAIGGGVVLAGCLDANSEIAVPRYSTPSTPVASSQEINPPGTIDSLPPEAAAPQTLSPSIAEIVKLAQSTVSEDVILAYIANAETDFNP